MRPPRDDIAAPELPPRLPWVGARAPAMSALVATGPVLVHFFDFAHLNSIRALPYLIAWNERYAGAGLSVLGAHSPRFPFTRDQAAVPPAIERLGIMHPVAVDSAYALWRDYGVEGWPSLFLWARGGALRWFHFGEGEYEATERAIQEELRTAGFDGELPAPLEPLRPTDAPGALVAPPSEELFPGGSPSVPWRASGDAPVLEHAYAAGGAYASVDGAGELGVSLDDGDERNVLVDGPGLYELASHPEHERHRVRLRPAPSLEIYAVSFAAGMPP